MEQVVFPVPSICQFLTTDTRQKVFLNTEKDEQNSKISGFVEQVEHMWDEMKWQKKLRKRSNLYWFSSNISYWNNISFKLAVIINLVVAFFYPFPNETIGNFISLIYILIKKINIKKCLKLIFFLNSIKRKIIYN